MSYMALPLLWVVGMFFSTSPALSIRALTVTAEEPPTAGERWGQVAIAANTREVARRFVATDFATLQEALNAAGKAGGEVFIPAGSYAVTRTLRIPSNVTVTGAGSATILKATAGIGANASFDNRVLRNADSDRGNSGIVVRDLVINGGFLGEYFKTGIYGISLENCDNCRIERVTVRRCSGEGILVAYGAGNVTVEGCTAEENNHGINVHHRSGEVMVRGNVCRRNGTHKPRYGGIGIFVEGIHHILIESNVCIDNAWAGIIWMGGKDETRGIPYPAADCIIANNVCRANGSQGGIFINGNYSTTSGFLATGNLCRENGRDGLWAFKASDGIIANNLCVSNNKPATKDGALEDWQRTASGIRLTDSQRIVVTGNRCLDEREVKWQAHGIKVEGGSKQNVITNNLVSGNREAGVQIVEGNVTEGNVE